MKSRLFVISGASGVGKGTVLSQVMGARKDLKFSVSATTRPPRPNEIHGVHYWFITEEEFRAMIDQDRMLEYDYHNNTYYGTPRDQIGGDCHVILDIDVNGAFNVKKSCPEAVLIFIMPPSMEELERRLRGRGDTPEEQILMRLERAKWEMEQRHKYDYVVVNDTVECCAGEILDIIAANEDK